MELNYEDALDWGDEQEVGVGKVYNKDGTLKYEWNLTTKNSTGFKKSYNRYGQLVREVRYNSSGEIIQDKTFE